MASDKKAPHKVLPDGTHLLNTGDNIHTNHIHYDKTGEVILNVKENNESTHSISGTRSEMSKLYEDVTGEKDKFKGGYSSDNESSSSGK
jgi:hypothetical protein